MFRATPVLFLICLSVLSCVKTEEVMTLSENREPTPIVTGTAPHRISRPYGENEAMNELYALLFCDDLELFRSETELFNGPWRVLLDSPPNAKALREIAENKDAESRVRLLAFRELQKLGEPVPERLLLGVVVEVGMDGGLDTLAAYRDGTARYFNYSGKSIIWESETKESTKLVKSLFEASENVVRKIGPWEGKRLPPPSRGNVRMTFLVSDGLYFGEGSFSAIAADSIGGPVVSSATELMLFLTDRATDQSP